MSTLAVVEEILRETAVPMSVREIVERAGVRLPSKSKTPDTVVARDLSMDIKRKGEGSLFIRSSPGRYTLRALHLSAPVAPPYAVVAPVAPVAPAMTREMEQGTVQETPVESASMSADVSTSLSSALRNERASAMPVRKPVGAVKAEDGFAADR